MKKQLVDLAVFLISLFFLFAGWMNSLGGSPTVGLMMIIGSLLALVGVSISLRKPKVLPTKMIFVGLGMVLWSEVIVESLMFIVILGLLLYGVYITRWAKK